MGLLWKINFVSCACHMSSRFVEIFALVVLGTPSFLFPFWWVKWTWGIQEDWLPFQLFSSNSHWHCQCKMSKTALSDTDDLSGEMSTNNSWSCRYSFRSRNCSMPSWNECHLEWGWWKTSIDLFPLPWTSAVTQSTYQRNSHRVIEETRFLLHSFLWYRNEYPLLGAAVVIGFVFKFLRIRIILSDDELVINLLMCGANVASSSCIRL